MNQCVMASAVTVVVFLQHPVASLKQQSHFLLHYSTNLLHFGIKKKYNVYSDISGLLLYVQKTTNKRRAPEMLILQCT